MEITVIIPTSVIPSHPNTAILDQTIASVRSHLPSALIFVTCDGLKPADVSRRAEYETYIEHIRGASFVRVFEEPVHQSGMLVEILPMVETPLILYLEHDWALGHPIEWKAIESMILACAANYVKFAPGMRIHPLHEHMMQERILWNEVPFIRTVQYSANPHVASTMWYRKLAQQFLVGKTDYIENLLHGPLAVAPWDAYKLMIYNPVMGDMKRAFHLDGANTGKGMDRNSG